MKLEDQVCSFELSKKLKELRVKQESLYYWRIPNEPRRAENAGAFLLRADQNVSETNWFDYYSAFSVAELGNLVPDSIKKGNSTYFLTIEKTSENWWVRYPGNKDAAVKAESMAVALAKMLVYLLENKLLSTL